MLERDLFILSYSLHHINVNSTNIWHQRVTLKKHCRLPELISSQKKMFTVLLLLDSPLQCRACPRQLQLLQFRQVSAPDLSSFAQAGTHRLLTGARWREMFAEWPRPNFCLGSNSNLCRELCQKWEICPFLHRHVGTGQSACLLVEFRRSLQRIFLSKVDLCWVRRLARMGWRLEQGSPLSWWWSSPDTRPRQKGQSESVWKIMKMLEKAGFCKRPVNWGFHSFLLSTKYIIYCGFYMRKDNMKGANFHCKFILVDGGKELHWHPMLMPVGVTQWMAGTSKDVCHSLVYSSP